MRELAILEYELDVPLKRNTELAIAANYVGQSMPPSSIKLEVSLDNRDYTVITDRISLAKDKKKFYIRVSIGSVKLASDSGKIKVDIRPLSNLEDFIDAASGFTTEIPFTVKDTQVRLRAINIGNKAYIDKTSILEFEFDRPLMYDCRLHINAQLSKPHDNEIENEGYSWDGLNWVNLSVDSRIIDPAIGTRRFFYRYTPKLKAGKTALGEVEVAITEVSIVNRLLGVPIAISTSLERVGNPAKGTLLRVFCDGVNKKAAYADGNGGEEIKTIQPNSVECNWSPPTIGTVLKEYCAIYNRYQQIADGRGGYIVKLLEENNKDTCGYVDETANTPDGYTPTRLIGFGTNIVSNTHLGLAARKRDGAISEYGSMHSKWYWEFMVSIPDSTYSSMAFGICTDDHNKADWIGSDNSSWGIWPYDKTKYHDNTKQDFDIELKEGDIVSMLLDTDTRVLKIWINGVDKGVVFENLPEYKKFYFILNGKDDSYARVNFGQYTFKYNAPSGYVKGFGPLKKEPPTRASVKRTYCLGPSRVRELHDGRGGVYTETLIDKDPACGSFPSAGTIIGYICKGVDRYKKVADGQGDYDEILVEYNSLLCGYTPPELDPTRLVDSPVDTDSTVASDGLSAKTKKTVRAVAGVYSGKYYYEVQLKDRNAVIGWITDRAISNSHTKDLLSLCTGKDGYCMDVQDKRLWHNGRFIEFDHPISDTSVIGVALDLSDMTIGYSIDGRFYPDLMFTDLDPARDYYAAYSGGYDSTEFDLSYSKDKLKYPAPNGYSSGYGTLRRVPNRRGTIKAKRCVGYDEWIDYHDGNGGAYSSAGQVNSTTCGYKPPKPRGEIASYFCRGYDRYVKKHDGSGGYYDELVAKRSRDCGFKVKDELISTGCSGYDKIGTYSNGDDAQTTYTRVLESYSVECGYVVPNNYPRPDRSQIYPNLPVTTSKHLKIIVKLSDTTINKGLVFTERL